jgi:signal transduction histidine kinase
MKIPGRLSRGVRIPPTAGRDALLLPTVFLFNCYLYSSWRQLFHVSTSPWLLLVWLYGLVGLFFLVWRDKAPVTVFVSQWILTVAAWPISTHYTPVVGVPISLYAVAVHCSRKTSVLALLASLVPIGLAAAVAFEVSSTFSKAISAFIPNIIFLVLLATGAWVAGRSTRANQRRLQTLEYERKMAREALAAERNRIARELHDIVSHAVTVIVLQAAGAARVAETNLAQVIESLGHIQRMGEQAMAELGRLLGVLKADDGASPTAGGLGELGPQSGLAELPVLLGSLRATGMPVSVDVDGTPRALDPSVDLTAYRIMQEGLTNVLKHAGKDSNARLRLVWEAQNLLIQIDNDIKPGVNPAQARRGRALSNGRGLLGLCERAHAAGGHLQAGPAPNRGGYRLTAALPFADTAQRHSAETRSYDSDSGERYERDQGKVPA